MPSLQNSVNRKVSPVIAAIVSLNHQKMPASAQAVAIVAGISETDAINQMLSRHDYGQITIRRFPSTQKISGAIYIGATVNGERGRTGIFVFDGSGEPCAYPDANLTGVHLEWID